MEHIALKLSSKPAWVGFRQVQGSQPSSVIFTSISRKHMVSKQYSTVNFMLSCSEFKIFKILEHELIIVKNSKNIIHVMKYRRAKGDHLKVFSKLLFLFMPEKSLSMYGPAEVLGSLNDEPGCLFYAV